MAGIRLGGLVTGLDTDQLIQQLMALGRRPVVKVQERQNALRTKLSAWRDVGTRLATLRSRASDLTNLTKLGAKLATPSDDDVVSATATSDALVTSFKVYVDRLATATRVQSSASVSRDLDPGVALKDAGFSTAPTAGSFTINGTTFTIDENTVMSDGVDDSSSNSILGKINSAGIGVIASLENDRLVLRSTSGPIMLGSGADTSNFLSAAKVLAAPRSATITSGIAESANAAGTVASSVVSGATITFDYHGTTYTTSAADISGATQDVTTLADLASQIETAMNNALGTSGSVRVTVDTSGGPGAGRLIVTDASTGGTLSVTSVSDPGLAFLTRPGGATEGETVTSTGKLGSLQLYKPMSQSRASSLFLDSWTGAVLESKESEGEIATALAGTETVTFTYHGTQYTTAALIASSSIAEIAQDLEAKMNAAAGLAPGTIRVAVSRNEGAGNDRLVITDTATDPAATSSTIKINSAPSVLGLAAADGGAARGLLKVNGVEILYDKYYHAVADVIRMINNSSAGVTVSYDTMTDRLTFSAEQTGSISIAFEDVGGNFLSAMRVLGAPQELGQNAVYRIDTINGGAALSSTSNRISNVIPGVTLDLKKTTDADGVTVDIRQDVETAKKAVQDFISQYNSVISFIRDKTKYDAAQKVAGDLQGDAAASGIAARLRRLVTDVVEGLPSGLNTLADIGITTGKVGSDTGSEGTLELDSERFEEALARDLDGVAQIFADKTNGVAVKLVEYIDEITKASEGLVASRQDGIQAVIDDYADEIERLEARLALREEMLRRQFAAMESALASMRNQSDWAFAQVGLR